MPSTGTLVVIAIVGGLAHVAATVKWYQPGGGIPAPRVPLLESVIFGVTFGIVYFMLGAVLRSLAAFRPPLTEYLLLAISVGGLAITVALIAGRAGRTQRFDQRVMSTILAAMIWLVPLFVLIL